MKKPLISVPGQRLCLSDKTHESGHGTYERQGYIYSSLAGIVDVIDKNGVKVVEVQSIGEQTLVPVQGDIVTAQVTILTQEFCKCIIRREDVRATDKDRVQIYKNFRPGDVILARVLPITEAHTYNLSTAENELGVVIAHSEHGYPMVPISWTQMQCTKTYVKESRKVAKVVPENMNQKTEAQEDTT
ncbi:hypothetical protein RN001_012656 [Aquatica leii]|uniref:Exosome complex component CSL4 n=1 Tax=Aquatica leii TaxID=1421715 RepID=A0AAN7P3I8_9COLE|nr:hypothetical protein RN001_012656 [Aquatica leii]